MPKPPFRLKAIDHVVLRVTDLERAVAFYCDVLGSSVEREQKEVGLMQLRAGSALIDLVPVDGALGRLGGAPKGKDARNMDHFALTIEPFDEEALGAHLSLHGVAIEASGARYGAEGEGPSVYIRDPDGNSVEPKGPAKSQAIKSQ